VNEQERERSWDKKMGGERKREMPERKIKTESQKGIGGRNMNTAVDHSLALFSFHLTMIPNYLCIKRKSLSPFHHLDIWQRLGSSHSEREGLKKHGVLHFCIG
jgi:hypothetical protein